MATAKYAELRTVTPPTRDTLQDRVYRELRVAIMSGRFEPGRALTIRGLAAALGTSPMPVREALRQLVAERALTMVANRSFGTPVMSAARFLDLAQVRSEIEGYAAARAATRLDAASIHRLEALNADIHAAFEVRDFERLIALNHQFHFLVYEAAGSEALVPIIETLWLQIGPYLRSYYGSDPRDDATDHHARMIEAFRARDEVAAARALRDDIRDGADLIARHGRFSAAEAG